MVGHQLGGLPGAKENLSSAPGPSPLRRPPSCQPPEAPPPRPRTESPPAPGSGSGPKHGALSPGPSGCQLLGGTPLACGSLAAQKRPRLCRPPGLPSLPFSSAPSLRTMAPGAMPLPWKLSGKMSCRAGNCPGMKRQRPGGLAFWELRALGQALSPAQTETQSPHGPVLGCERLLGNPLPLVLRHPPSSVTVRGFAFLLTQVI